MELIFDEEGMPELKWISKMKRAAEIAVSKEGIDPTEVSVSVSFVNPEEIRTMNLEYRQKDAVTDVLSFPQFDDFEDLPEEGEICLGDVVICYEQAESQAREFGHAVEREVLYLFVHSMFHLLGYDHMEENEKAEMRKQEEAVMTEFGLERD